MARQDKNITKQLEKAGWRLHRVSKHEIWHCPCGEHRLIKATTLGGGRGVKNFASHAKKQGGCSVTLKFG